MAKPRRDPLFLKWVRQLPCCICLTTRGIEAAHVGPHGLGIKACDRSTIPLCPKHHRSGPDSLHNLGPRRFEEVHGVILADLVARLNTKPRLRIEGGRYYAQIGDRDYLVGNVHIGPHRALRCVRYRWYEVYLQEAG